MVWYDHMILGRGCGHKENLIRHRITHRKPHVGVWLITLPTASHLVLEIVPSTVLLQKSYPTDGLTVIGMALTKNDAIGLAADLVAASIRERGDADIAAYLGRYKDWEMGTA